MTFTDLVLATYASYESPRSFVRSVDLQIEQGKTPEVGLEDPYTPGRGRDPTC